VDLDLQAKAEAAVNQILPNANGPAASMVSIEPTTGYVRAMVGGRDFFGTGTHDKFNLATQSPGRHSGSSFKPFVLATAIEQGIDPFKVRFNAPACITIPLPDKDWRPCNAEVASEGRPTIAEGTVHSINTLYAQLIMKVGPQAAVDVAKKLGIESPLQPYPSAVLGTNDVTTYDMASAYATFANLGVHVPPTLVTKITRADGTTLYEREHTQEKVISADTAATVSSILQGVIERGTGKRAKLDRPAAGKTGTTDDYRNAWFVGYTPELSTAVWVGFSETQVSMRPPATPIKVFGGTYPAEIWQRFMSGALTGRTPAAFPELPTTTTTLRPHVGRHERRPRPLAPTGARRGRPTGRGGHPHARASRLRRADAARARRARSRRGGDVQSPAGVQRPVASTVTLEVTEGKAESRSPLTGFGHARAGWRGCPVTTPSIDAEPRRWTAGRVVLVLIVVAMLAMWGYVLYLAFGPGRQPPPDQLADPAFGQAAEEVCRAAHVDVAALPPAVEARTAAERAEIITQANDRFATMLDDLEPLTPAGEDGAVVQEWLADWHTYLSDRVAYAEALASDPEARLYVTAKDNAQITEYIDAFAADNHMQACGTPIDV
jgi:hypothetical protein